MLLTRPSALHLALVLSLVVGSEPAILDIRPLPNACFQDSAKQLCLAEFKDYLDDCLDAAEPSDFVIKGPNICYKRYLNRCIPLDTCPEALINIQV